MRPFLKWLGNKYRIVELIHKELPDGKRLVEPFVGSGAVFLNSSYPCYLLAEQNADLINLYHHLKKEGPIFIHYCEQFFTTKNNAEKQYYRLRSRFNALKNTKERAAIFLYLNRHGYNGLCRYNLSGGYNVPFGRYIKPYFPAKEMLYFHEKSQQCLFIHSHFNKTLNQLKKGDVIYCDPPYVPLSQSANFTSYTQFSFAENEQRQLAEKAGVLAKKGFPVVISNHDTPLTRHYYQHARIISFDIQRYISCQGKKRQKVKELLAVFS